ncbi:hypothetical protein PR001_g16256 [Phytophthora rubi]|nr:hypothetical protein PR001_g16256 [Phytophthora rubi]
MVGSISLIFILSTVHQGMDLSLTFNWEGILNGTIKE